MIRQTPSRIRCPLCEAPVDPDNTPAVPFCSERCKMLDLGKWLDEAYGLPAESEENLEDG